MVMKTSANQKFLIKMISGSFDGKNESIEIECFELNSNEMRLINRLVVKADIGINRCIISNDGKYLLSALFDYGKVYVYEITTGKIVNELSRYPHIDDIYIRDYDVYICSEKNVWVVDIIRNENKESYKASSVIIGEFGCDIYVKNRNTLLIDNKRIKSNKTIYITGITTTTCVVVSEMGGNLYAYSYKGEKLWEVSGEFDCHFISLGFCKQKNRIYAISFNYNCAERSNIVYGIDVTSGAVISKRNVPRIGMVFVNESEELMDEEGNIYSST